MKNFTKKILSTLLALVMAMPMIMAMPSTASATDYVTTLFDYEFTNGSFSDSVNSSSTYDVTQINAWTTTPSNSGGVLTFTDADFTAKLNDNIRNATYKKHWKISMRFKFNNTRCRIEERMLSLATSSAAEPFFGLSNNGYVTVNGTNERNSAHLEFATPITGTDKNADKKFNSSTENTASYDTNYHIVAYEYNNGSMKIFFDGALIHKNTISDTTNFENLQYINIGGYTGNGSGLIVDYVKGEYIKNSLVGAYFTRNATDGVKPVSGEVTWDNTNGAYFNGSSSLEIDGTPFNSVTDTTGFTITFETMTTSVGAGKLFNFRNTESSATDYFSFNCMVGNAGYQNNSVVYKVDGKNEAGVWIYDFYNDSYFFKDLSAKGIVEPAVNTKYRFTISMDDDGYMYYYRDGEMFGKLRNNYYTQEVGKGIKPSMLKNAFIKFTKYMIGENFTGYIKNMYLFDSCLTDSEAQAEIAACTGGTLAELESAINAYETKMDTTRNGATYTNMGAAYQAYVMAHRAHDAYVYGGDTTINLSLYIDPLRRETAEMNEWSAWRDFVTGRTVHPATGSGANYTGAWNGMDYGWDYQLVKACHNILYTGSEQNTNSGTDTTVGNSVATMYSSDAEVLAKTEIYYNTTVLLYTGGTDYPYFPVGCRGFRNSTGAVHINAVYPTGGACNYRGGQDSAHSAFEIYNPVGEANNTSALKDSTNANATGTYFNKWSGHDDARFCIGYIEGKTKSYFSGQRFNQDGNYSDELNNKRYYAAACLYYTTPTNSVDKHNIKWASATMNADNKGANGYWSEKGHADATVATYVVNYKTVTDDISNNLSKFSNITAYKAGGALAVLNGYQIDAGLDLSNGRFAKDVDNEATILESQIDTAHSYIGSSATADSASSYAGNYATFRSYITSSDITTAYSNRTNTGNYTTTTFANFLAAYDNAKAEMAKVLSVGYTRQSEMGTAKSNLETAFNALDVRYDFTENYDDWCSTAASDISSNSPTQIHTTTTLGNLSTAYGNATYKSASAETKADTGVNAMGETLDAQWQAIRDAHNALDPLFDFSALETVRSAAATIISNNSPTQVNTTSTLAAVQSAYDATTYSEAQKKDTGVSQTQSVNAKKDTLSAAITAIDTIYSVDAIEDAYEDADDALDAMKGATALYSQQNVSALVKAANNAHAYYGLTDSEKKDIGTNKDGATITAYISSIEDSLDAIESSTQAFITDVSAYQSAVYQMENIDSDIYDYPSASSDLALMTSSISTTVNYEGTPIKVIKNNVTMERLDAVTSILQSLATEHTREYKIDIASGEENISDTNGVTFNGGSHRYDEANNCYWATYGTKVNLKAKSEDTAWYMEFYTDSTNRGNQYQDEGKYFTASVFGNIHFNVQSISDGNKVTIYRTYSDSSRTPKALVSYVSGTYTLPTAPTLVNYRFTGYTDESGNALPASITVSSDTVIYANYEANPGESYTINKLSSGAVAETKSNVHYNDEVKLTGNADTYAWAVKVGDNYRPFYVGKDVTFFATENQDLEPMTAAQFSDAGLTVPNINVRRTFANIITEGSVKYSTFNGQFVFDENSTDTIAEYGILLGKSRNGSDVSASKVDITNIGKEDDSYKLLRFKSTKDVGAHQFSMRISGLEGKVTYKAYLIYKDSSGTNHTVYSDAVSGTIE